MNKYNKNISIKSLFYFCSLPLRLDSYSGCTYGCLYCFSQRLNNRKRNFSDCIFPANKNKLFNLLRAVLIKQEKHGLLRSCIERKIPFHFGCISDPLQPIESKHHITYQHLQILNDYDYPYFLCTKSDLLLQKQYYNLILKSNAAVQISFSTFERKLLKKIEPNAPLCHRRFKVLEKLSSKGVYTVVRMQPFMFPREKVLERTFKLISELGVKHVVLEHLRIPTNTSHALRMKLNKAADIDFVKAFREIGIKKSRISYELKSQHKLANVLTAKKYAHKYGMTFGSGDNDFHHLSDMLCCCGKPALSKYRIYEAHIGRGAFNAIKSGKVSFSYVENGWHPIGSIREQLNSDCRIEKCDTIADMIKNKIANPFASNSPTSFYGINYKKNDYCIDRNIRNLFKKEDL